MINIPNNHFSLQPCIVTVTSLVCELFLYSISHTPCQVPKPKWPLVIGMVRDTPLSMLFTCPGMSSGPSSSCSQSYLPSGASLLSTLSISLRTVGSQFSLMQRPAEVCKRNMLHSPTLNFLSYSPMPLRISSVTRQQPRFRGFSLNVRWTHSELIINDFRLFDDKFKLIMIVLLILSLLVSSTLALSGSVASSYCHCDLTISFCDIGCCCDADCTTTTSDCYNLKSNSFCPDPTFFSRLGSTYLNSQGCFYYNSTSTIVDEISLASRQVSQIINQQLNIVRVSSANGAKWAGYLQGDAFPVGGSSSLSLISRTGNCLTAVDSTAPLLSLKFGLNMKLACVCTGCSVVPRLFSVLSGSTINQYSGDTSKTITLPSITDPTITDWQINFIIGRYGSQGILYIERVSSSSSANGGNTRSLTINFIQPSQILAQVSTPTFFPQIPSDMFYPIYLLS